MTYGHTSPEWVALSTELRALGYVHCHGNRYCKAVGRKAEWAAIVETNGSLAIQYT